MTWELWQLETLVASEDWSELLANCSRWLRDAHLHPADLLRVHGAMATARAGLGDHYGAIPEGLLAVRLAKDTGRWDDAGLMLLQVASSYLFIRQYDQAVTHCQRYFEHRARYGPQAQAAAGRAWLILAVSHLRQRGLEQSVEAAAQAAAAYRRQGDEDMEAACNDVLVRCYAELRPEAVPPLLHAEAARARRRRGQPGARARFLLIRAWYLSRLGDHRRCLAACRRGLRQPAGDDLHFHLHMVAFAALQAMHRSADALAHAHTARRLALGLHRYDLEHTAASAVQDLLKSLLMTPGRPELPGEWLDTGLNWPE